MQSMHRVSIVVKAKLLFTFLLCLIGISDGVTPFKNRGNGGSLNSGVMMNTANVPNLINQVHNHGHGHSVRPTQTMFFGDKYPVQMPAHSYHPPHHHYHYHHTSASHHTTQTHKRQFRNPFDVIYEWRQLDFEYPTFLDRQRAILSGDFIPTNNLPLGIDRWRNRLFVTMPRWKNGVPASLATLPLPALDRSPPMRYVCKPILFSFILYDFFFGECKGNIQKIHF